MTTVPTLDPAQMVRIEGVHRGFLYQHLYAVECLLHAMRSGVGSIIVERDEDVEIVFPDRRIYVQVKTRSEPLTSSDIAGALERFDALRVEHREGRRAGSASFVIATNAVPGPHLMARVNDAAWHQDTALLWPSTDGHVDPALPLPKSTIDAALAHLCGVAETLPYARLAPETLIYKLAGAVMAASAGNPPRTDHAFRVSELPALFEQLVVQLQDFPSPPAVYRSHANEPALQSAERIRIVTGFSGAGKTSWVSQAAIHAPGTAVYVDLTETPAPALAATVAREIGARLLGQAGGQLGNVLLPGATGAEMLNALATRLADSGDDVTVVLDNAHRVPATDIQRLVAHAKGLKFLLLCQPGRSVTELEAVLRIAAEPLRGWDTDSIALEVVQQGCRGDYSDCQRLRDLTSGMPLYVQNAVSIATTAYEGSIRLFCDDLEAKTHVVETAQELILVRAFNALPEASRNGIAVLSLSDIPLDAKDASALLMEALRLEERVAAGLLRQIRSSGFAEVYGASRLKIHDAVRLLGTTHLETLGDETVRRAQTELQRLLAASLKDEWSIPKFSLYLKTLAALGDVKTLVELGTDELFHELGVQREILGFLEGAAASAETAPDDRFWALDGLLFSDLKAGDLEKAADHADAMTLILDQHELGPDERLALAMKRMNILAINGDAKGVASSMATIASLLPAAAAHQRIFRYNAAHALHSLGKDEAIVDELGELIQEYYEVLGITLEDVFARNPDQIWPKIRRGPSHIDDLKHLADCLALQAAAIDALGGVPRFQRIHAMKFYQMATAIDSIFSVGKDLVVEFIARNDFVGARQVIETNLLPNVLNLKVLSHIVPVRSQYAVILAYCGEFDAADAEMKRLAAYEAGLDVEGQLELANQRRLIAEIRRIGPPRQWTPPIAIPQTTVTRDQPKIGRNSPCQCGSGKKFKNCHGRKT